MGDSPQRRRGGKPGSAPSLAQQAALASGPPRSPRAGAIGGLSAHHGAAPALQGGSRASGLAGVRVERIVRLEDSRGHLAKIAPFAVPGEVYCVSIAPGCSRGHHFHLRTGEWFTSLTGGAVLEITSRKTEESLKLELGGVRVWVPPGLVHAIYAPARQSCLVLALADTIHDPDDVYPWP